MSILEYLLVHNNAAYLQECMSVLPFQRGEILATPVHRLELAPELVACFYDLEGFQGSSSTALAHLLPHLTGMMVIGDRTFIEQPDPHMDRINQMAQEHPDLAYVVGIRVDENRYHSLNPVVHRAGLYLAERGRLFFWNPQIEDSLHRLWQALLLDFAPVQSSETEPVP